MQAAPTAPEPAGANALSHALAPQLALVAGEASGDLLAGLVLDGLRARWPHLRSCGIGGARMQQSGFEAWWPSDKLAVHGYGWEVLRRYREIVGIRRQLKARLLAQRPNLFVGVDAPDFNLDLETDLKAAGIKTVHLVAPSVWAWRPERVEKIRRAADHVLCIFPFEPDLLAAHGIAASYVGHPLAQIIPKEANRALARQSLGLADDDDVLAILPGSRRSEISHLAAPFFAAARLLLANKPQLKCVVPAWPPFCPVLEQAALAAGLAGRLQIVLGQSHTVLAACDVALIASGTATLEAALFRRPMVIAYRMNSWSWQIMRRQQLQPWVGLPNILCRQFVVPELLQAAATPAALAQAVQGWLDAKHSAPEKIQQLEQRFAALHDVLHRDTSALVVKAIAPLLHA
jgi:lipid-A-disaccharide synthase